MIKKLCPLSLFLLLCVAATAARGDEPESLARGNPPRAR